MQKFSSNLVKINKFTDTISEFEFKVDKKLDFKPGQFVMMEITNWSKISPKRAYSVVSYKSETDELILCIENVNWIWTTWIFNLKEWDTVNFIWPIGNFNMKNDANEIYFFATWIWLPPIKCLIETVLSHCEEWNEKAIQTPLKQINLLFWTRHRKDIYYEEWMQNLANKFPNFKYEICLSREEVSWYHHWYITNKIKEEEIDFSNSEVYYCGSIPVKDNLKSQILTQWLPENRFYCEAF